jgi:hypothetical protein
MNNFGTITYFTVKTVYQGLRLGRERTFNNDNTNAVPDEAHRLTTEYIKDTDLSFSYQYIYNQTADKFQIALQIEYSQPILDPVPYQELDLIPSEASTVK